MMRLRTAVSSKFQPVLQRAIQQHGGVFRPMTIISKSSAEEYKKQVRFSLSETIYFQFNE